MTDYQALLSVLVEKSGIPAQELESQLRAKIESLGHLVNEDVALRLVARDLNITLAEGEAKKPCVQVVDLVPGMNNINLELTIESMGSVKEFTKKDGTSGRLLRVTISDPSGKATLVAWDEQTSVFETLRAGSKVFVHSAYTKSGFTGGVEIHLGRRSKMEVIGAPGSLGSQETQGKHEGIIWRASGLTFFNRKDGSPGTLASFLLKEKNEMIRILLWNPAPEKLSGIKEGMFVEIINGSVRKDLNGKPEVHVNNIDSIRIRQGEIFDINRQVKKLSEVEPNMEDIDIEAIVESVFDISTTYNGKSYLRLLIREGETVLPLTLWNDKALELNGKVQVGSGIRIESCFSKLGPKGLELALNRWSRLTVD